ncbi:MAG: ABC-2 transporter permease, partial [Mycobacteriales bacterium]
GAPPAAAGASRLAQGAAQVLKALQLYETTNPEARVDPVYQQALAGQEKVVAGLDELARALTAAEPGTQRLASGAGQVATGAATLATAAARLAAGVAQLQAGSGQLAGGAGQLLAGSRAAAAGGVALAGGLTALSAGATSLVAGEARLAGGASRLASGLSAAGGPAPRASAITDAVRLASKDLHPVRAPAAGFAPYAAALALWVGVLVADLALRRRGAIPGWRSMAALVGAQTVGVAVVTAALARVPVGRALAVLGFALLAAATLAAVLALLRGAFGSAGFAVAVALLVLQLTSTAWVYPIQTAPRLARFLHPLLPTTYLVRGLRAILAGANGIGPDVSVLVAVLAVAVVGAAVLTRLRPGAT